MIRTIEHPRIYFPRTISEALDIVAKEPDVVYWAGGSSILRKVSEFPSVIISLSGIEELNRASRTEQFLDIGSMITLDKLASISRQLFPVGLSESISRISRWPIRCKATIGGNLANQECLGDLVPLLYALDAKVEVRFPKTRRNRVRHRLYGIADVSRKLFVQHALLTRISIPLKPWNFSQYTKILPDDDEKNATIFCAVAKVDKNSISDLRVVYADSNTLLPRDLELESSITGRNLPFSKKELLSIENAVNRVTQMWEGRRFERETAADLIKGFLLRLEQV